MPGYKHRCFTTVKNRIATWKTVPIGSTSQKRFEFTSNLSQKHIFLRNFSSILISSFFAIYQAPFDREGNIVSPLTKKLVLFCFSETWQLVFCSKLNEILTNSYHDSTDTLYKCIPLLSYGYFLRTYLNTEIQILESIFDILSQYICFAMLPCPGATCILAQWSALYVLGQEKVGWSGKKNLVYGEVLYHFGQPATAVAADQGCVDKYPYVVHTGMC